VTVLRSARLAVLKTFSAVGLDDAVLVTRWRRQRLLILGYHGISLDDEHCWDAELYMPGSVLRRRLELIREAGCRVLPLDEAVRRMYAGDLPPRSVVLTFDDGTYDFYARAFPIIESFGYPVTVYFTTYYAEFNRPVYDAMVPYLLWKGRDRVLRWPEVLGPSGEIVLAVDGRRLVKERLGRFPVEHGLTGRDKDAMLGRLSALLGVDYDDILKRRLLHLMSLSEARELAARGVDLQLHTHRHRVSFDESVFDREIVDNRARLRPLRESEPTHFCYPGGVNRPEFLPWLRGSNIASATTCEPGIATRRHDRLLLPRYIDTAGHTEAEFRAWLTGVAALLPRRRQAEAAGQFLEAPVASSAG
jgi:peptidoglycan/xylan/chitin deacetylase (PgdA/CDA1 family)